MTTCSIEGCDGRARAFGYCGKHYMRFKRHGDPLYVGRDSPGTSPEIRIMRKVRKVSETGCWEWTGTLDGWGYGMLHVGNKFVHVYRISYSLWKGALIPGLEIDHICHNRKCVNPDHLRQVTKSANQLNRAGVTTSSRNKHLGVSKRGNRYTAKIKVLGNEHWLGTFDTEDEAVEAVDAARRAALEAALGGEA